MGYNRIKTEMKGDRARWGHREDIKHQSKRLRRLEDREQERSRGRERDLWDDNEDFES